MNKKKRRLKKTVKQKIRIFLVTLIVTITGLSYSLIADADNDKNNTYPAYQNTVDIDTQSNGKISLSVTAEEHTLPEDTKISLKEITDTESEDYKKIQEQLNKNADDDNVQISGSLIYELSLTDADDNPIESVNDNKIHVYTSYETHATPLTENNNEEISLKYLSNDSSYALTEPSDDDPVTINTDDNNAITDLSMDVHGSTYYALVWSKKPEITEHAVDEDGNELIDSNTLQVSEETDVNTLAAAIDGYTLTSVTADNTDITAVKAEKGKLYFNNGQDWTEASDNNVWFHYAPVEVSEDTDADVPASEPVTEEDTDTEEVTEPETEETPVQEETDTDKQLTASTKDNKYTVTVTYGEDAGLPEGTKLSLTSIDSKEEKYADAKKAVASDKNVKTNTLGMEALDITLTDSKGNKVEPDSKSSVQVSISVNDLPDDVNSVDIHHITEEDTSNDSVTDTITRGIRRMGRIFSNNIAVNHDKASAVARNVSVTNNTANAEFNVNSFSTFTITWTTTNGTSTARIAQVKLHYVDEDGNELADPTNQPSSDMFSQNANGIITLKDYAEDNSNNNASRMANYTYTEARLSNAKTGTVVTGFMGKSNTSVTKTTYSLKYTSTNPVPTSTDDSNWKDIPADAITGVSGNSVDVYLIYTQNPHITVHYVNDNREEIAASSVEYAETFTNETQVTTWSDDTITVNGTPYTRKGTHLGKASGKSVYSVQSAFDAETKEYTLQYKKTADAEGENLPLTNNNADLYVVYDVEPSLTIHYVDETGKDVATSTKKYADTFTSEDGINISSDTTNLAKSFDSYSYKDAHLASYTGTTVTHVRAVRLFGAYKIQVKSGDNGSWEDASSSNLYLVYDKTAYTAKLNIHYMDIGGEPIKDASGNSIIRYLDASDFTTSTDVSASAQFAITINGYTFSNSSLNQSDESQSPTGMTLIASGNAPKNGDTVKRGATVGGMFRNLSYSNENLTLTGNSAGNAKTNEDGSYDIYLLYVPHLTIHYVDSEGNELYSDNITSKSSQWGNSVSDNSATLSNYYNGHGTPDHIYDALPTATEKHEITSLKWGHSTSVDNNNHWLTTLNGNDETTVNGLVKDVYMVYDKTVTVHHVDENGNNIADDTKVGITSGTEMTSSSFAKSMSGYTAIDAYFANPNTDTPAQSFSSVTYTNNEGTWSSTAIMSDRSSDSGDHNEVWVVYQQASMQDIKDGITIHYVNDTGNTVAADKFISTSSWSVNTSSSTWGWNGAGFITNGNVIDGYLPTSPTLGQPTQVYLGSVADGRQFTLSGGNRAINFKYDSSGWQTGIDSSGATTAPTNNQTYKGLIMDLTFVYPTNLNVTIHHIDGAGNKIADDTQKTVSANETITPSTTSSDYAVNGYTLIGSKVDMAVDSAAGTASGGNDFYSYSITKTDSGMVTSYMTSADVTDAVTPDNQNEVWLVYSKNITFHYVDSTGANITGLDPVTTTASLISTDGATIADAIGIVDWAKSIENYTFSNAYLGKYLGTSIKAIRSSNGQLQAKLTDDGEYTSTDATDIYLVYDKVSFSKEVDVYYTDIAGKPILDASGNPIMKKYDAADWGNTTHDFSATDARAYTPDGYVPFSTYNDVDDRPHWWENDSTADTNNRTNRIIYVTGNYVSNAANNGTFGYEVFRDVRGYAITSMTYNTSDDSLAIKRGTGNNDPTTTLGSDESTPYKVYIMYKKQLTIHDVDADGNELGTRTSNDWYVGYDPKGWNSSYSFGTRASNSVITPNTKYGTLKSIYVKDFSGVETRVNTTDGSNNFQIAWQFSGAATKDDITPDNNANKTNHTSGTVIADKNKSNGTGKWITRVHTGSGTGESDYTTLDNQLITDVYMVYDQNSAVLNNHYGYMTTNDTDQTTSFNAFTSTELTPANSFPSTFFVDSDGESVVPGNTTVTHDSKTYYYVGTYLSSSSQNYARLETDAPRVTDARVKNGNTQYLVAAINNQALTLTRRNIWTYSTSSGRLFTLRKTGDNLNLIDSQNGTSSLNLMLVSTSTDDGVTTNVYKADTNSENVGTEYTLTAVTESNGSTSYKLDVSEWRESKQTHLYHVYRAYEDHASVTIRNDMINSGQIVAEADGIPQDATDITYTWYKRINGSGDWKRVERTQSGTEYNIDNDPAKATYVDVIADDGVRSTSQGRAKVEYKVQVSYKEDGTEISTPIESSPFDVPYYDQLENGDFENVKHGTHSSTLADFDDGTFFSNQNYKKLGGVWQTTGVGTGNSVGKDIEIVDASDTSDNASYLSAYGWPVGSVTGAEHGTQFAELNAEAAGALYQDVATRSGEHLNYWLSHRARGFSGSRPAKNADPKFDTMYLVIMPSSVAMTGAPDGGELTKQADLENFLQAHGGYESSSGSNSHTKEENTITYYDENSGVLVARITSDNQDWHSVNVANGYVAKSSLTRFFFVAGPTSAQAGDRSNTIGNMLDNVGFSQRLQTPVTPHYHMVVTKTFSGLDLDQVAKLASNRDGQNFAIKTKEYSDSTGTTEKTGDNAYTEEDLSANLNDATLGFKVNAAGDDFTLTAVAHDGKTDLLAREGSAGVWSQNPLTGDITMTWTLASNRIDEHATKYFKVIESNYDVDGYNVTTSNGGTVEHASITTTSTSTGALPTLIDTTGTNTTADGNTTTTTYSVVSDTTNSGAQAGTRTLIKTVETKDSSGTVISGSSFAIIETITSSTTTTGEGESAASSTTYTLTTTTTETDNIPSNSTATSQLITIHDQDTGRVNFSNAYRDIRNDGQPEIVVKKTFTGVTPSVVEKMLNPESGQNPYQITLTKDNKTLTLRGNSTPYSLSDGQSLGDTFGLTNVILTSTTGSNGSTELRWTLIGKNDGDWLKDGNFNVNETNYSKDSAPITSVSINSQSVTLSDDKSNWSNNMEIPIGTATGTNKNISSLILPESGTKTPLNVTSGSSSNAIDLDASTNMIVSSYSGSVPGYLVWTESPLALNDRAAVIDKINALWAGSTTATSSNTSFQSGDVDTITGAAGSIALGYNGAGSMSMTYTASAGNTWTGYYATTYTGGGKPEIEIANSYEPAVRVMKVSSNDYATPLQGAEFRLYTYNDVSGTSTKQYLVNNSSVLGWGEENKAIKFTTNEAGVAVSDASKKDAMQVTANLVNGTYYLEETKAPPGYNMPVKNVVAIHVDANGIVTQITNTEDVPEAERSKINTSTSGDDGVTIDWNSPYYTITVKNTPGILLPITGGHGVYLFYIAGALIIAIAGVLHAKKKLNEKQSNT